MAHTRKNKSKTVNHPNGALETTFQLHAPAAKGNKKSKGPSDSSRQTRRSKNKAATTSHVPDASDVPSPPYSCQAHTPTLPEDPDNPFVNNNSSETPPAGNGCSDNNDDGSERSSGSTLPERLHAVAIARTTVPRAGPHSPERGRSSRSRSSSPPRTSASRNKRVDAKDVWTFFELKEERRWCTFCKKLKKNDPTISVANYAMTTGSGILRQHLCDNHRDEWIPACDALQFKITAKGVQDQVRAYREEHGEEVPQDSESAGPIPTFSKEAFADAITNWIIEDDQPVSVIDNPHLRRIFRILRESLKEKDIPHRTHIRDRIMEYWEELISTLTEEMKTSVGKISFTMDMWTDLNMVPYMAVTAHWLKGTPKKTKNGTEYTLELRADLIGFYRVPGNHTGEHLAEAFLYITNRLGIRKKFGWVTLDNASNNNTCCDTLEERLTSEGIEFDRRNSRIRCFPHIVNLACQAVLEAITDMKLVSQEGDPMLVQGPERDVVAIARSVVRNVRTSSLRRQYFAKCQKSVGLKEQELIRDVKTRWSSTFLMISRILEQKEAVKKLLQQPDFSQYKLVDSEWGRLRKFRDILRVPHAFQQRLSSETTPTLCDAIPSFQQMIDAWERHKHKHPSDQMLVNAGITKIQDYLDRIEDIPAYTLAMILNPAIKLEYYIQDKPTKVQWARDLFERTLREYRTADGSAPKTPARPSAVPCEDDSDNDDWADEILGPRSYGVKPQQRSLQAEINDYLGDPDPGMDCIKFWEARQTRYPTIFLLAADILPIQGSAVPCERVFSSAKETTTPRRNNIKPQLMEALQMLKFSLKKGHPLNFTKGTSREDEIKELENAGKEQERVPSDVNEFINQLNDILEDSDDDSNDFEGNSEDEDYDSD